MNIRLGVLLVVGVAEAVEVVGVAVVMDVADVVCVAAVAGAVDTELETDATVLEVTVPAVDGATTCAEANRGIDMLRRRTRTR